MIEILLSALLQTAAGAPADPPAEQAPVAAAQAEAGAQEVDRNVRRCRAQTATGSRLRSRVCLSAAEEAALEQEAEDLLRDASRMWDNQSGTIDGGGR